MCRLRTRGEAIVHAGIVTALLALAACSSAVVNSGPGSLGPSGPMDDAATSDANSEDAAVATDDAAPTLPTGSGSGSSDASGMTTNNQVGSGSPVGSSGTGSGTPGHDAGGASGAGSGVSSGMASSGMSSGATFTMVYAVLSNATYRCISCHGSSVPMLSLANQSAAYASLVGVAAKGASCAAREEQRVAVGSSATSLLYTKIAGTQDCGVRMPETIFGAGTTVSSSDLATVKSWIDNGAPDN
jgi:hypothetical protein